MPESSGLSPEKYAKLRAEAKAPYRGLRQFAYFGFGASALIGAIVFCAQLAAGRASIASIWPDLVLQFGILALMGGLFYLERRVSQ